PTDLVYQKNDLQYVTFHLGKDTVIIRKDVRPIEIKEKTIRGFIHKNSNLSTEINKATGNFNTTFALAASIEGIYAWSVDFFHLQKGDKFVVVYNEKSIDGVPYGIGKIKYAWFEHAGEGMYAFYYQDTAREVSGYYDDSAKTLKRPFLKSPV